MYSSANRTICFWIVLCLLCNLSLVFTSAHAIHNKNQVLAENDIVLICHGTHLQPVGLSALEESGEMHTVELPDDVDIAEHDLECKLEQATEPAKSPLPTTLLALYAWSGHLQLVIELHPQVTNTPANSPAQPRAPPFVS